MARSPEAVEISEKQYNELLKRVERKELSDEDWTWVVKLLKAYWSLIRFIEYQKVSLQKLRRLLFGKKSEKTGKSTQTKDADAQAEQDPTQSTSVSSTQQSSDPKKNPKKAKAPGHGRRPHDSWENAEQIWHPHTELKSGCACPRCKTGKLYPYADPAVWVRIMGQAPLVAEVHKAERLRCNPCGALFTARVPQELQTNPPEANVTAAIIKYQAATPFHRQAEVQKNFGHPIPRTRISDMCVEATRPAVPVIQTLVELAAQGEILQNDDTGMTVLQLVKEVKEAEKAGAPLARTGMNTSVIVSRAGDKRIYLFFTGRDHAGENLKKVLGHRSPDRPPPIQVCDPLSANTSTGVIPEEAVAGCHDHARRKYVEIRDTYPTSCQYVLDEWKTIYETDALAKQQNLDPPVRLSLHQKHSHPVMERLYEWSTRQLEDKIVEPNSHLGAAISYFLKNYSRLTLFLRKPGIPLSNCECEQAIKVVIGKSSTYPVLTNPPCMTLSLLTEGEVWNSQY